MYVSTELYRRVVRTPEEALANFRHLLHPTADVWIEGRFDQYIELGSENSRFDTQRVRLVTYEEVK